MITSLRVVVLAVAAMSASGGTASGQNFLADPSFEGDISYTAGSAFGSWKGFSSSPGITSGVGFSGGAARTGFQKATLLTNTSDQFAGVFQDVLLDSGSPLTFGIWNQAVSGSNGQGIELRLEYRDSISGNEISRTPNATPGSLGSVYERLEISGVVPLGADTVRAVYGISSFGEVNDQRIYVDDAYLELGLKPVLFPTTPVDREPHANFIYTETNSQLVVFDATGLPVLGGDIDRSKPTVVMSHGYASSYEKWPTDFANQLRTQGLMPT